MAFSIEEYVRFLASKGIVLQEKDRAFIEFGQHYTGMSEQMVTVAIELTLKIQREFDGSYYIALLETFKNQWIASKQAAYAYLAQVEKELIQQ
ncbi:hypothetical protein A374_04619 [Fictibacillus macauensis ZFHKF-1]|uniref:Uncharacterized protein n=1 Tax=Fictibacillus macauensis ZFHKF-1 TaxID=1196324 RepID=I8UJ21_9BACL|nr:DUF6123 family protein [Fictibacillus macauensis]EIT86828.1 hypothetical protein A374_04619 [Fictibacillus macauensis ZFHKF-1]